MSIKTWWADLKKLRHPVRSGFDPIKYHEEHLTRVLASSSSTKDVMVKYHGERLVAEYREENNTLRRLIIDLLQHRKTPSKADVTAQMNRFAKAHTALSQDSGKHSTVSEILMNAYLDEWAKLMYLFFDDIDIGLEEATKKVEEYKNEVEASLKKDAESNEEIFK